MEEKNIINKEIPVDNTKNMKEDLQELKKLGEISKRYQEYYKKALDEQNQAKTMNKTQKNN